MEQNIRSILLLAVLISQPPESFDAFERWLCERAKLGLLDCTHGNETCKKVKAVCKPYWEPKVKEWWI